MEKLDKLRAIIKKDVSSGFMHEFEKHLRTNNNFARKLNSHPDFIPLVIDELVEAQLPFYNMVSEAAVDAAHAFFMSAAGDEWIGLSQKFVLQLNDFVQKWSMDIAKRLQNTN